MTILVPDPENDRTYVHLFDDPVSKRLLNHENGAFAVALVSATGHRLPPALDALGIVSELVADPAFPLDARRRAVEWLKRQGVAITVELAE